MCFICTEDLHALSDKFISISHTRFPYLLFLQSSPRLILKEKQKKVEERKERKKRKKRKKREKGKREEGRKEKNSAVQKINYLT